MKPDIDLYKIALEEYRFQVSLNWDRTKFYITLNLTLFGSAAGIFRLIPGIEAQLLVLVLFALGIAAADIGRKSLLKGHEYYRKIVVRKTQYEKVLNLLDCSPVVTTDGMQEAIKILDKPEEWHKRPLRSGTITSQLAFIFRGLQWANITAVVVVVCHIIYLVITEPSLQAAMCWIKQVILGSKVIC